MKFFFPDSQDFVDPSFDFVTETRSEHRKRQRDDLYPHEVFEVAPYDGILVSKSIVDRRGAGIGKYTIAQRQRILRDGVRAFFRLDEYEGPRLESMGDCGAFSYVREEVPPWSVDEVATFYEDCGFDYGISVDHVIPVYNPELDLALELESVQAERKRWERRQQLTLDLAQEFFGVTTERGYRFEPIGVAQGWSPASYQAAVLSLQETGYTRIALGGMVSMATQDVKECLRAVATVRECHTELHLLGVTRLEEVEAFEELGVTSFDSTSPLKQAFKSARDNYHTLTGQTFSAVRVPQVDANPKLKRRISSGEVDGELARELEESCLTSLAAYDREGESLDTVLDLLDEYQQLYDGRANRRRQYERVLGERPWRSCDCAVCADLGIHVILFRGAERNRRRGFHNLHVTYERLRTVRSGHGGDEVGEVEGV